MSNKRELAKNATDWMEVAKQRLPPDIGAIFIFFDKSEVGRSAGVVVGNVTRPAVVDQLKATLRSIGEAPLIIVPGSGS